MLLIFAWVNVYVYGHCKKSFVTLCFEWSKKNCLNLYKYTYVSKKYRVYCCVGFSF